MHARDQAIKRIIRCFRLATHENANAYEARTASKIAARLLEQHGLSYEEIESEVVHYNVVDGPIYISEEDWKRIEGNAREAEAQALIGSGREQDHREQHTLKTLDAHTSGVKEVDIINTAGNPIMTVM